MRLGPAQGVGAVARIVDNLPLPTTGQMQSAVERVARITLARIRLQRSFVGSMAPVGVMLVIARTSTASQSWPAVFVAIARVTIAWIVVDFARVVAPTEIVEHAHRRL